MSLSPEQTANIIEARIDAIMKEHVLPSLKLEVDDNLRKHVFDALSYIYRDEIQKHIAKVIKADLVNQFEITVTLKKGE